LAGKDRLCSTFQALGTKYQERRNQSLAQRDKPGMTARPITRSEAEALFAPLARFPRLALAVSGGPDSVALMQTMAWWAETLEAAPRLSVLTVDHGLRAGSRQEAQQVGSLASALGLRHAILPWEREESSVTNLQAKARAARYDLMAAYCHAQDIPALVTAHTQDDQAETFLMRLGRGSGLDGLAAIPQESAWAGIAIFRPLLDVPKARLVATLEQAGIPFVCDPSNADPRFERARLRQRSDALSALGLTPEALALSARRLRRAREALDAAARDFLAKHSEVSEAGYAMLDREALAAAPQEIALRAIGQLIAAIGGGETPVQLAKLEKLMAALEADPEKAHTLGRCRLQTVSDRLGLFREVRGSGLPVARLRPGERMLWDNRFRVELGRAAPGAITVRALDEQGLREMRERSAVISSMPPLAGKALPACFRGEVLIGLPALGRAGLHGSAGLDCRARFVGSGLADEALESPIGH
jgi:tRNA(Ile)-lysidine synthase